MRRRCLGIFLLVLLGLLVGVNQTQGAYSYKSEAQVAGEYITLSHLVELPPELAQKCGSVPIWSAPPPGEVYTLTQEFLKYRLEQLGLTELLRDSPLPAAIQVRQTGVLLKGEDVAAAFRRYVEEHSPYPAKNLSIEVSPLKEAVILPDEHVALQAVPLKNNKLFGQVTLEMVIMHEGQPIKRLKVSGLVRLKRLVVCAARPLSPQTVLSQGDIRLIPREVTGLDNDDLFHSPEQVLGHVLAKGLGPQEIITARHLSTKPLIKQGDEVTVIFDQDGLEISTKGVAREQGYPGKPIRLVNPKSKKEFQGLVVNSKTVKVQL
ncbi:MAG: flagellar basal body P-ring formation chaperone FlgA [Desulfobaccales bacterium]